MLQQYFYRILKIENTNRWIYYLRGMRDGDFLTSVGNVFQALVHQKIENINNIEER